MANNYIDKEPEILIISHNSSAVIFNLLDELYGKFSISVVDNASSDSSAERIRSSYPLINLVELKNNIGYGNASNIILENTKNKYVLLLNPDIEVKAEEISKFLEISKNLDFAVTGIDSRKTDDVYTQSDWVIGCAMLFNIEKMQKIGFFDKKIFLYGEENDLCYRIIKSGAKIYYINNIEFKHLGTKSSPSTNNYIFLRKFHQTYSGFYLKLKHSGRLKATRLALGGILKGVIQYCLSSILNKNPIEQKARILASIYFLIGKSSFDKDGNGLFTVKN